MRRISASIIFLVAISSAAEAETAASKIVSLKPTITDVVIAMGHGDRLVGVTKYCDASGIGFKPEIVGDYTRPYIERIIALRPDIVLGSRENSSRRSIERLRNTGIDVELFPFSTLAETLGSIRKIGEAIGAPEDGNRLAMDIEDKLFSIKKDWGDKPTKRVVIVWGRKPLVVAGKGSYIDELLPFIGATNAVDAGRIMYPHISMEEMIAIDPDAIIDLSMGSESMDPGGRPWEGISALKAVRENMVLTMDTNDLSKAGPKLPDGLKKLASLIHK